MTSSTDPLLLTYIFQVLIPFFALDLHIFVQTDLEGKGLCVDVACQGASFQHALTMQKLLFLSVFCKNCEIIQPSKQMEGKITTLKTKLKILARAISKLC